MKPTNVKIKRLGEAKEISDYIKNKLIEYNISESDIEAEEKIVLSAINDDGGIIAGVSATLWGGCLEIDYLWVSKEVRGCGVGSLLLQKLENDSKAKGCKKIIADTYSFQAPAFYEKSGYFESLKIDGYSNGSVSKIFYVKEL
jgi:GNAT superfamily N-acetyltransferase